MKLRLLIFYLIVLNYLSGYSQQFEWIKSFGTINNNESIISVCPESNGNCVFVSSFSKINPNSIDTLAFDTFFQISNSGITPISNLVKVDSSGKVLKVKTLGQALPKFMCNDSNGNFYIAFGLTNLSTVNIGNSSLNINNGNIIVAKFNPNFDFEWICQTGNSNSIVSNLKFTNGRLIVIANSGGSTYIGQNLYNLGVQTSVIAEIDTLNGSIIWSNYLYINNYSTVRFNIVDLVSINKDLFLAGTVWNYSGPDKNITIVNDTFFNGAFIVKTDSIGNFLKSFVFKNGKLLNIKNIASNGDMLFIGGTYFDSLVWNKKNYYSNSAKTQFYFAALDTSFNSEWFFQPIIIDNAFPAGVTLELNCIDNFLYSSIYLTTEITIDGNNYKPGSNNGLPDILILKFDLVGNVLWGVNGGSTDANLFSIKAISEKFIYLSGTFKDSLNFKGNSVYAKGNSDAFLTKLSDNAIIRGEVGKGPYCAGDSIKVPYKKIGDYDTSNYFIAELSDEQGNFTGNQRELGRLKSNNDGIVTGLLPSLSVASSNKYRIRIISTAPAVQSYYKVDTLRLLIYSKDKAWAGNDTVICKGDSLQLETFGGTKWHWSPSYKLLDSTARTTFAWPDKTTTYRITIADSSGCGAPDTAYKTIMVRPELKLSILTPKDTTVCIGGSMPIIASFSGGDSLNYTCQWYSINSLGIFKLEQETILQQADTLQFTMPINEPDSMRFVLYLSDGCTPKTAFANYTLKVKKQSAQVNFEFKDTSLCPAIATAIVVNFTGSPKDKLSWSWQENTSITNQWVQRRTGSNKQSDTWNYTLPLTWKGTKKIRLLLNDACSGLKDTSILNITPKDTLSLKLNTKDTTLCHGQWYTYKALGKGGNKDGYKYVWTDVATGDTLSMADSLKIQAIQNLQIRLHLSDGCMPKSTSAQFEVKVRAPLKINIANPNDTVLCDGQSFTYVSNAVGGNGQYSYHWLMDGQDQGSNDSFTLTNDGTLSGLKQLKLIVSDGCTNPEDTAVLNINLKPALSQTLTSIDSLCFGASSTLETKASGGIDNYVYQWLDNNTTLSNTDSLKITNTQSGKVRYTSIVNDGCSLPDTISIDIINLDPLKIQLSTTDSCPTGTTIIRSKVSGGKASQLKVSWFNNNIQIHQGDSLLVNPSSYSNKAFTAIASDGCSVPNDTESIRIGSAPKIKIMAIGECLGDTTKFIAKQMNSTGATNYAWTLNGNSLPFSDSTAFHSFTSTGPYKIKVEVNSNGTCKGNDSLSGFILNKPKAAFTLAHFDRNAQGIPFRFIDQSSGANGWLWNFGNGDTSQRQHPDYTYNDTGKARVVLTVSNNGKCFDSTSLLIPVMDKIEFFMPNVFSPNGNSINETFGLSANQWNKVKEFNLKIYNRWGEKVFDSDHMEEHWTGEGAQQSVYIYKLTIRDVYNVLHEMEGVVELLE